MKVFYGEGLSLIHDKYFKDLVLSSSIEILNILKSLKNKYTIVALGCGSGVLTKILSDNGFNVLGIDISENMIDLSKIKILLNKIGFEVKEIKKYNNLNLRKEHFSFICYKNI